MLIRRILMNAQDTSPGTGAPSTPATTPAPAAAPPPAAPAPQPAPAQGAAIDVAAITRSVTESVTKAVNDGVFATLRRAGVLLPNKPTTPAAPATGDATTSPPAATATIDPTRMRALDRALNRAGHSANLDDRAYQRIERAFAEESPDNADQWVTDYFSGFGVKASAPATAVTTTTTTPTAAPAAPAPAPQPATAIPVTDRGSPPPSTLPLEERKLQEMSQADRDEYIRRHGLAKYNAKLMKDLQGVPVR